MTNTGHLILQPVSAAALRPSATVFFDVEGQRDSLFTFAVSLFAPPGSIAVSVHGSVVTFIIAFIKAIIIAILICTVHIAV